MDDTRCRQFFLEPTEPYHRHYEALRAFFVEGRQLPEIAQQFGYQAIIHALDGMSVSVPRAGP